MWPKAVTVLALGAAAVATWALVALIERPIEWLAIASDQPQLPGWVAHALTTLFVYYAASVLVPFFLFVGWRTLANTGPTAPRAAPFVSIIIPAFDEEPHIANAIDAALDQDYPSYEVIIIDDGSSDFTKYVADRYDVVRLIALRANLGKAHALNAGLAQAMGSIVVCSDSDSALARDALKHLVAHFADPAVGAMAGTVEIPDPRSFAQRLQSIEYIYGQNLLKLAQLGSGSSVAVCPGPISAFRRTALLQIGGFTDRTLTEDFDATLELIRHGFAVGFDPRAVASTSAPSTWQLLVKQRMRWSRGALQTMRLYKALLLSRTFGALGLFWLPYFLFIGYGGVILDALLIGILPLLAWSSENAGAMVAGGAVCFLALELLSGVQFATAIVLAGRASPRTMCDAWLMKPFTILLAGVRLAAMFREFKGHHRSW